LECTEQVQKVNVVVVAKCIYKPYVLRHSLATSSAECNHCSPPSSLVCEQLLTKCDIVLGLPQGHLLQGPTSFYSMHSGLGWSRSNSEVPSSIQTLERSNPDCQIVSTMPNSGILVGSSTSEALTTTADFHLPRQWRWCWLDKCLPREAWMMAGNFVKYK